MRNVNQCHAVAQKAVYEHYALQKVHELTFILCLLEKDDIVVEIGCDAGGTSWAIKQMQPFLHIGIDLAGAEYSSGLAWQGDNEDMMIWGNSHSRETRERLSQILDGRKADILIVDGDHSYDGVSNDFRMYAPLCSGLVIFHDICYHQGRDDVKVDQFYGEIKHRYPHVEYIAPYDDTWGGIGVLDLSKLERLQHALQQV